MSVVHSKRLFSLLFTDLFQKSVGLKFRSLHVKRDSQKPRGNADYVPKTSSGKILTAALLRGILRLLRTQHKLRMIIVLLQNITFTITGFHFLKMFGNLVVPYRRRACNCSHTKICINSHTKDIWCDFRDSVRNKTKSIRRGSHEIRIWIQRRTKNSNSSKFIGVIVVTFIFVSFTPKSLHYRNLLAVLVIILPIFRWHLTEIFPDGLSQKQNFFRKREKRLSENISQVKKDVLL
jgi:hypothetical protein